MRTNKFLRAAAVIAFCAVVSASFLASVTMARYHTGVDLNATAQVAAFDVNWETGYIGISNGAVVMRPNNWTNQIPIRWTMLNDSDVSVIIDTNGVDVMITTPIPATGYWNVGARRLLQGFVAAPYTMATQQSHNPTPHTIVPPGGELSFSVNIQGYTAAPGVPAGATGGWGTQVIYGVGHNHSLNMTATPFWRTYRANADIRVVQVD